MAVVHCGKLADKILESVVEEVTELKRQGVTPSLAVILIGQDAASKIYVKKKVEACLKVGMLSRQFYLPADASEEEVLGLIDKLNNDVSVHGILVQLPIPRSFDKNRVLSAINEFKDVDSFHPSNIGLLAVTSPRFTACTPAGIMELFKDEKVPLKGAEAVVVGHSNIVGKPIAFSLLNENATVTVCHSSTRDLAFHTKNADILIVAVGKPGLITGDMVKPGAFVVDVGINRVRLPDGKTKVVGDVDRESVEKVAGKITPVPGGVGKLTVAMLLKNTVTAAKLWLSESRKRE
ncbi:MAG: bifunctional 5,10-methylenetetrahydrofolate dehydrogenase/5,10-methenyltetrahydrofolate cyclohydrolase [Candidatus Micrarchaeia archaeon]